MNTLTVALPQDAELVQHFDYYARTNFTNVKHRERIIEIVVQNHWSLMALNYQGPDALLAVDSMPTVNAQFLGKVVPSLVFPAGAVIHLKFTLAPGVQLGKKRPRAEIMLHGLRQLG